MSRTGRWGVAGCLLLLLGGLFWGGGFVAFNHRVRQPGAVLGPADGIVVLTGGADRIETAMRLLAEGRAPLMLVSGVGRGLDFGDLIRRVPLSPGQIEGVTLGRMATTTLENAEETAAWAHLHGVRRLIVVTAGYHMPRALIEIGRALPDVALYPMPVQSPVLRRGMEFATVRVIANEYDKYLVVRLGLGLTLGLTPGPVRRVEAGS